MRWRLASRDASRATWQAALAVPAVGRRGDALSRRRAMRSRSPPSPTATLFHSRVQDDAHPAGHVGVVVISAALAMGKSSGRERVGDCLRLSSQATRPHCGSAAITRPIRARAVFVRRRLTASSAPRPPPADCLASTPRTMTHALRSRRTWPEDCANIRSQVARTFRSTPEPRRRTASWPRDSPRRARPRRRARSTERPVLPRVRRAGTPMRHDSRRTSAEFSRCSGVTYKPYPICQFHRGIVRGCASLRERAGLAPLVAISSDASVRGRFFRRAVRGALRTFPQTFMSAPFCAALAWARGTRRSPASPTSPPRIFCAHAAHRIVADPSRPATRRE